MIKEKAKINSDLPYLVALSHNQNFGFAKVSVLLRAFGSVKNAFEKTAGDFEKSGANAKLYKDIEQAKKILESRDLLGELEKQNIKPICFWDTEYPEALKEISSPPYIIYQRSNLTHAPVSQSEMVRDSASPESNSVALSSEPRSFGYENTVFVAVIGTRSPSYYGKQVTYEITYNLAKAGVVIVSGLALGLDAVAHQAALEAGGKTVAVLGNGLDKIYPSSNHNLGVNISKNGAVISEYPPGVPALKQNFPARNRIIAGLSLGTVVVEAKKDSGSLITANFALEQNREVFAVPGNINNPLSEGPNNLIKLGAKAITGYEDILTELNLEDLNNQAQARQIIASTKEEAELLKHISKEPINIDLLVKQSELPAQTVNSTLTMMEIKGKVRNIAGAGYIVNN